MVQPRPSSAARSRTDSDLHSTPPPWERALPSVPYMPPHTSQLSSAEREAPPAASASRNRNQSQVERLFESPEMSSSSTFTPKSSPALRGSQDAFRQGISRSTTGISVNTCPTCNAVSPRLNSVDELPEVQPFPGTISTRNSDRKASRHGRRGAENGSKSPINRKQHQGTLTKRLRDTIHGIFKREPIDESMYEKIETHHWADDSSPA